MDMRIRPEGLEQFLAGLVPGKGKLVGQVQRLTPLAVVVRLEQGELELPLANLSSQLRAALREGLIVELQRSQGQVSLTINSLSQQPVPQEQQLELSLGTLAEALEAMAIRPTAEALQAAQGLLDRGFPLQKDYLRLLLPFALQGKLEEALLLLEAGFPVRPALVELVTELKAKPAAELLSKRIGDEIPPDLQEQQSLPSSDGRAAIAARLGEGRALKALVRQLAAEQFLNSLLNHRSGDSGTFVFFLPFVKGTDLKATWIKVGREGEGKTRSEGDHIVKLEFLLPTDSFGVVTGTLLVLDRNVSLSLIVERNQAVLSGQLAELERELAVTGWKLGEVKVSGVVEPCAGQLLSVMIGK